MDRKTLLAMTLCFLIFMGWQKFYIEPRMPKPVPGAPSTTEPGSPTAGAPGAPPTSIAQAPATAPASQAARKTPPEETRTLAVGTGVAKISNGNGILTGWDLKGYRLGIAADAAAVDLKHVTEQGSEIELAFDHPDLSYLTSVRGELKQGDAANPGSLIWTYEDENVRIVRQTAGGEGQAWIDATVTATFKKAAPKFAFLTVSGSSPEGDREEMDRNLVYHTRQSTEYQNVVGATLKEIPTPVRWAGAASRYFLLSLLPKDSEPRALIQPAGARAARISLVYPVAGNSISIPFRVYFGPKELNLLRAVDPTLDHTVDFGWFTIIAYPILTFMKWLFSIFHNYGIAIILLTIVVKILLYPLTYKSMKSMKEMAKLQPQLQKIREKYADDKEALNREMLSLMKTHGYNPAAGCLPILIQMPIFFALYRVLYSSIELYHAPFALWIHDLSEKDPYFVTPVLLTATMYIQQKMTPNTTMDPAQQKMLQFMPIMFGAFMLTLPSGLTIYMLTNAIASIVQQAILNKKLDVGHGSVGRVGAQA